MNHHKSPFQWKKIMPQKKDNTKNRKKGAQGKKPIKKKDLD